MQNCAANSEKEFARDFSPQVYSHSQNHKDHSLSYSVTAFPDTIFSVEGTRAGLHGLNST